MTQRGTKLLHGAMPPMLKDDTGPVRLCNIGGADIVKLSCKLLKEMKSTPECKLNLNAAGVSRSFKS